MKLLRRIARVGLVAVFGLALGLLAESTGTRPIQLAGQLEAEIPRALKPLLLDNPTVRFLVTVNEEGKLVDHLAVEATHCELLPRAEEILTGVVFEPAVDQGKPVQATAEVVVSFYDAEQRAYQRGLAPMPFGSTTAESASRRLYVVARNNFVYRRAEPSELDQPVRLRETKIMVLKDTTGQPAAGECVVEFYVDARGEVRMPRVLSSANDTVALSALLTLQHTHFEPITRKGMPAYVRVRQPMSFAPAAEEKPATK